jgi:hypothetical protein
MGGHRDPLCCLSTHAAMYICISLSMSSEYRFDLLTAGDVRFREEPDGEDEEDDDKKDDGDREEEDEDDDQNGGYSE